MSDESTEPTKYFVRIADIVKDIPSGCVMTYGQVAAEARTTARSVGWAMAINSDESLPWHRVVGSDGYLLIGRRSPELMALQRKLLERDGVTFLVNGRVDMAKHNT